MINMCHCAKTDMDFNQTELYVAFLEKMNTCIDDSKCAIVIIDITVSVDTIDYNILLQRINFSRKQWCCKHDDYTVLE